MSAQLQHLALGTDVHTSPAGALRRIIPLNISGRLTAQDPRDASVAWRVYLSLGEVHFAHSTAGYRERLGYALNRLQLGLSLVDLDNFPSDYEFLCHCWRSHHLSLAQLRQLLLFLTQEALVQLLALPKTQVKFENLVKLDPLIVSMPFERVILPIRHSVTQWKQFWPYLGSPFQRPAIRDSELFHEATMASESPARLQQLEHLLGQNLCFYQIAPHLDLPLSETAEVLGPLVKQGAVGLQVFEVQSRPEEDMTLQVVCIDDSQTVQRHVKGILETSGYQVMGIVEPAKALTSLVRCQPDLILMDINMPGVDGYELCRMLRKSERLKKIPIVMLTGRDGMFDRLRAKVVGATDYLTKPFKPEELLVMVGQFTQQAVEVS